MIRKTFRVFISSTFSDFLKERELLNVRIGTELEEFCASYGYDFQFVDLRWGVTTESALNQRTMEICLNEVQRCLEFSPKPNFLLLVGERYGWTPLPSNIKADVFEQFYNAVPDKERALVDQWYKCDTNAIEGEYYLVSRSGEYVDENRWNEVYERLSAIFSDVASKNPGDEFDELFGISATEREIYRGLFDTDASNVIAVFRNNSVEYDENELKNTELKKKITSKMLKSGQQSNLISFDYCDPKYLNDFEQIITEKIKDKIREEITRLSRINEKQNILNALSESYQSEGELYYRDNELEAIKNYVDSESARPMLVYGEPGSGKSRLLAEYTINNSENVEFVFFSLNENSCNLLSSLQALCNNITERLGINLSINMTYHNAKEKLYQVLEMVSKKQSLLIVIDGLDMFFDIEKFRGQIIPEKLPKDIKIIVSYAEKTYEAFLPIKNSKTLEINAFTSEQCEKLTDINLKLAGRTLNSKQWQCLRDHYKNGSTPLAVRLLSDTCIRWKSSYNDISIPVTTEEIALSYIENMFLEFGHKKETVLYTTALIATHPYGITEKELLKELWQFKGVKEDFAKEDRYSFQGNALPYAMWSRLFFDLQDCLHVTYHNGDLVVKFYHNIFKTAFKAKYSSYCEKAYKELCDFYFEQNNYINNDILLPNKRKSSALPLLLIQENSIDKIADILGDISFSDIVIKNGELDNLLMLYYILIESKSADERIIKQYNCIQQNEIQLRCYRNSFLSCCYEWGLVESYEPIMYRKRPDADSIKSFYIPYSQSASYTFLFDKSLVAICDNNIIHIYSLTNAIERFRIVYPKKAENIGLLWIDSNTIAAKFNDTIVLYRIWDKSYSIITELSAATKSDLMFYVESYNLFCYFTDDALKAYSVINNREVYSIPVSPRKVGCAGVCFNKREIYIYDKHFTCGIYDASTGESHKRVKLLRKKNFIISLSRLDASRNKLLPISDNCWIVFFENSIEYVDLSNNSYRFVHLPTENYIHKVQLTEYFIFVCYDNNILKIDIRNDFRISVCTIGDVSDISYNKSDDILFAITNKGVYGLSDEAFVSTGVNAYIDNNPYSYSAKFNFDWIRKIFTFVKLLAEEAFSAEKEILTYQLLYFLETNANNMDSLTLPMLDKATGIVFSPKGHRAIAYEGIGAIFIFDSDGNRVVAEKLNFGPFHSLLDMGFSDSGKTFYVLANDELYIFDTVKGVCLSRKKLKECIVYNIRFDGESEDLILAFEDYSEVVIKRCDKKAVCLSEFPQKTAHGDLATIPYQAIPYEGSLIINPLFDETTVLDGLELYDEMNKDRVYYGKQSTIWYRQGRFYFDDKESQLVDNSNCYFEDCRAYCAQEDGSKSIALIREKNDLNAKLIEISDSNLLILISNMLNSVIIFDADNKKVVSAYKHHGDIIGYTLSDSDNSIILYSSEPPHETKIFINSKYCVLKKK